jgi:hypothetical protein
MPPPKSIRNPNRGVTFGVGAHMVPGQLSTPGPEWVAFGPASLIEGAAVLALLDSAVPTPTGGGGIEAVARPGRRPLTVYRSPEALGLVLSVICDGHAYGDSVEPECRAIERMAGMFVPGDPGPQRLIVQGQSVPHCAGAEAFRHRWLISEPPSWGDDPEVIRRQSDGDRTRQQVTLTLLLATDADELRKIAPSKPAPSFRNTSAHKGDTYRSIAKRVLGEPRLGRDLARLNGDKDPAKKLAEGARVRLPSHHLKELWLKELKAGRR